MQPLSLSEISLQKNHDIVFLEVRILCARTKILPLCRTYLIQYAQKRVTTSINV